MKAFEFQAVVEKLFDCRMGEPRAWTRNPPSMENMGDEVPDDQKHWYAVFGYQGDHKCREERLVGALLTDFTAMLVVCESPRPTLLWRSLPRYDEGQGRWPMRTFRTRIVIPELAFGEKREDWIRISSHKPEASEYPEVKARR